MSSTEDQQAYAQGYHVGYQHGLEAARQQMGPEEGGYPVNLIAAYPEKSSRLLMFFLIFKPILLIPHVIILYFLTFATVFVIFVAWWIVVITGNYPKGLWDFHLGVYRWQMRVTAYMLGLTDEYPPFSFS